MSAEESIQEKANRGYQSRFDEGQRALIAAALDYDSDGQEDAEQELREQLLSFGKVTTHHREETIEWELLLGTGGPADRIIVTTDFAGQVEDVDYQYQDWFEPWTSAENQDEALLTAYAEIVGYYEDES